MRSRRTFLAALMSGAGSIGFLHPFHLTAGSARAEVRSFRQKWLSEVLPLEDVRYDEYVRMLKSSATGGPGYHTTFASGEVHATRASLTYAVALLDTGEPWRVTRGKDILKAVIPLQDQDPDSKTYGIWPWYLEEPLKQMSPPDWNWADFCGVQLLMAWIGHRDRLGKELAGMVQEAIVHAARSIQRRDVSPAYTNIAIMGTYVTLVAAQEFKAMDLRTYARERLRKLHAFITSQGSLAEYNSPTYTPIAIQELARMLAHVRDGRDRALILPLHELAWKHAASHFHVPTRQWAGPHSRAYETDLRKRPSTLAFIQAATGGRADFDLGEPLPLNLEAAQVPLECPRQFARNFLKLEKPRQVTETFIKADQAKAGSKHPVVGATWLHPTLTLGSVTRGDFWTQRRPLIGYWGKPDEATFLRVRFLKDDKDFSSALLFAAQHESSVLAAVVLSTDHGDKHPSLDPIQDGRITARDLRLRFEFGGELRDLVARTAQENGQKHVMFMDRNVRFLLRPLGGRFGGAAIRWDFPELASVSHIDAVLHQGEARLFDLKQLSEAFLCFALQEWPYTQKKAPTAALQFAHASGQLKASWSLGPVTLSVAGPTRPGTFAAVNDAFVVNASGARA